MENMFIHTRGGRYGMTVPITINKRQIISAEPISHTETKVYLPQVINNKEHFIIVQIPYEDFIKELQ